MLFEMRKHGRQVLSPLTAQFLGGRLLSPMLGLTHANRSHPRYEHDCLRIIFRRSPQGMHDAHDLAL